MQTLQQNLLDFLHFQPLCCPLVYIARISLVPSKTRINLWLELQTRKPRKSQKKHFEFERGPLDYYEPVPCRSCQLTYQTPHQHERGLGSPGTSRTRRCCLHRICESHSGPSVDLAIFALHRHELFRYGDAPRTATWVGRDSLEVAFSKASGRYSFFGTEEEILLGRCKDQDIGELSYCEAFLLGNPWENFRSSDDSGPDSEEVEFLA